MAQLSPLGGRKVLIVEDNYLIARELADLMHRAGGAVCGPASSSAAALALLSEDRPDGALLDVFLSDRDASPVARALAARGVPFLLVTGYERERLPAALRGRPCLSKPFSADSLIGLASRTFGV